MVPGGRVARSCVLLTCSAAAGVLVASPAFAADGGLPRPWSPPPVTAPGPGPSFGPGPDHGRHRRPPSTTPTTRAHATSPATAAAPPASPPAPPTPPPGAGVAADHIVHTTATRSTRAGVTPPPPPTATPTMTPPPTPRPAANATKPTTPRRPVVEAALASRSAAAERADDVPAAHHPNGLQGQALEALLAFAGLLAVGTFLRRFRPPVT